jgi:uncharacterized membrane protein YfcA
MTGLLVIAAGLGVLWFVPHGRAPVLPALSAAGLAVYAFGAVSGLVAGFLAGLLGIGGSLVVMPALYLLLPAFGVQPVDVPHAAVATALAAMLPTALCGTWRKHRQGTLDHRSLMRLAPGTLLGAAAGALFALQLHGPVLALAFVAQSAYYGWGQLRAAPAAPTSLRARIARRSAGLPASWCMAPLAGAFCACLGMGGGSLVVPYLAARGVALLPATAVSQGVNLCIALGGAIGFAALPAAPGALGATVCWPAALLIGATATLAVPFGVTAAPRTPLRLFRLALGVVNVLAAAVLLLRTLWP